jgi:hypothetical protein
MWFSVTDTYRRFMEKRQDLIETIEENGGLEEWRKAHPIHEITVGKVGNFKVIDSLNDDTILLLWTLQLSLEGK